MKVPRILLAITALLIACAIESGCGGGSGNFRSTLPPPPPPTGANYTTCNSNGGGSQLVPNWQSQLFISNYQAGITALVNHVSQASYASRIGYIRIGLSKGGEINLPSGWDNSGSGACYGGYAGKWGYNESNWDSYLQSMVQWEHTRLNSPYPLLVSITPITDIGTGPDDFIAQAAFQNGISYGNQGLEASDISNYPSCAGDWCNLFNQFPVAKRELQTLGQSCPQGTSCSGLQGSTGPLPPLLLFATGLGGPGIPVVPTAANDLEIYYQDWLIAYDPTDPNNGTYGAAYTSAIVAAKATGAQMQVLFPDPSNGDIAQFVLSQSTPSGVVIDVDWSDIQPSSSSSFDWSITDASINQWIGAFSNSNQKVNLVFQNTTYGGNNCSGSGGAGSNGQDGTGNCAMPAWMWTVLQ